MFSDYCLTHDNNNYFNYDVLEYEDGIFIDEEPVVTKERESCGNNPVLQNNQNISSIKDPSSESLYDLAKLQSLYTEAGERYLSAKEKYKNKDQVRIYCRYN